MENALDRELLKHYNLELFAKTGASVLFDSVIISNSDKFNALFDAKKTLLESHPHNSVLNNTINYFLFQLPGTEIEKEARQRHREALKKINAMQEEVSLIGAKKIKPGSTVFVHSTNNISFKILEKASKYKNFKINLLEHTPTDLGQKVSQKLSSKGIDIEVFPDLKINDAIRKSDMCMIGSNAFFRNKGASAAYGSYVAASIAREHGIPVYVCTPSWGYDHKGRIYSQLQKRFKVKEDKEVSMYEYIPHEKITSYITELGIHKPEHLLRELKTHSNWMFY